MRAMKWITLSLATTAAVGGQWAQASEQSEAGGFIEGSKLNVLERCCRPIGIGAAHGYLELNGLLDACRPEVIDLSFLNNTSGAIYA